MNLPIGTKETPKEKLARLMGAAKALLAQQQAQGATAAKEAYITAGVVEMLADEETKRSHSNSTGKRGESITLNTEQLNAVTVAGTGQSSIIIGAAGTGKTTCTREVIAELINTGFAGLLTCDDHKHLPHKGTPGIVCVSYTRRAVANLRKAMPDDMKANCLTIHALLEYEPVYHDIVDPNTGENRTTMRFEPTRHENRPLPHSIRTVVIDESSMVSVELFNQMLVALPKDVQFIFLGDIQQLPPVFGAAILGYKMLELPTTELTQVYRQALESPIIRLAHRILSGKPIPASEYLEWKYPDQLTLHPWKKKLDADNALLMLAKFLTNAADAGLYVPDEDMVLIPYNKACGTIELNKHIANHMAQKRGAVVHEIVAGFNRHYLSIGDKVLYDKEDAIITDIVLNGSYTGASFQKASPTLDYWGFETANKPSKEHHIEGEGEDMDLEFLLSQTVALGEDSKEDRVRQASHEITVQMQDTMQHVTINSAAAINELLLSYALTVHKSQGSEFRKVFLTLHESHNKMIQRELLYTAVTRAREELYVICEPETFTKGILSQRIKGDTLAEKAEYFKGKVAAGQMN